jgi:hypothetical protein
MEDYLPERACLLSCDESDQIVTQHGARDVALTIQTRGRKYGVEMIHSAQRPQRLHTTLLSQTDRDFWVRIGRCQPGARSDRTAREPSRGTARAIFFRDHRRAIRQHGR